MNFVRVRNFERYQHYADRRPPWIKLYRDLWDDPRFFSLSDAERYALIGIFVIASQQDNKVPTDTKWLQAKLLTKARIPLEKLIATGWLEPVEQDASKTLAVVSDASTPLSNRYPSRAGGETETEVQNTETDKKPPTPLPEPKKKFGEHGNILLTETEHSQLVSKFGLDGAENRIRGADLYIGSTGKSYKSHYLTILKWEHRNGTHRQSSNGTQGETGSERTSRGDLRYHPRQ